MLFMKFLLGSLFLPLILLCSCASKLTEKQKAAINAVAINTPTIAKDAYHEPSGGSDTTRQAVSGAGIYGGVIGGIAGSIIGDAIHAGQHSSFKKRSGKSFVAIEKLTPQNLDILVKKELSQELKKNAFFGPRQKTTAPYQFESTIVGYGLRRVGTSAGRGILLSPTIHLAVFLKSPEGKKIIKTKPHVTAVSSTQASIDEYVNDQQLLKKAYSHGYPKLSDRAVPDDGEFGQRIAVEKTV